MAKLNIMDRDNVLREFELTEDLITVGREATNKLVVADPSVSRGHAVIEKRDDGYYVVDKNSSNGTFINGKRITTQKLNHNDKLNFGNASMVFEDEEQVSATFILPREGMSDLAGDQKMPDEMPTDAVQVGEAARPAPRPPAPAPPPPMAPMPAAPAPPPPPRPAAAAPPPPPPRPVAAVPSTCPSCGKPIEANARFCGFCGASIAPRPAAAPPAPPPPAAARPPAPPMPPPPPAMARPVAPPQPAPPRPAPMAPPPAPMMAAPMAAAMPPGSYAVAPLGPRFLAGLIDGFIIGFAIVIVEAVFFGMAYVLRESPLAGLVMLLAWPIIIAIAWGYEAFFLGTKGATPGKKMMKLKVQLMDGTCPIGLGKGLLRVLGRIVSGFCLIGYIMIFLDKETHLALHDKIAGTIVVQA